MVPVDAATLILVRDDPRGLEVLCVERSKESRFLGGAIVFPGGKVDAGDVSTEWLGVITPMSEGGKRFAESDDALRALGIAACREALEEAAILPTSDGPLDDDAVNALRAEKGPLSTRLRDRGLVLDLGRLLAMARWVTPEMEQRRYDTRFFLCPAPEGQSARPDGQETTSSFWARPREVLDRFDRGEVAVYPPTHRMLEILESTPTVERAVAYAKTACLDPICPKVFAHEATIGLALPGDPEHDIKQARIAGASRFILENGRFLPRPA